MYRNPITQHLAGRPNGSNPQRGGFLYLAVLFTSLLLAITVTTAMSVTVSQTRASVHADHRSTVARAAESEVFRLSSLMQDSVTWRSATQSGDFTSWRDSLTTTSFGTVQVRHRYVDPDGMLADDSTDSVELTVHARLGEIETAIEVGLMAELRPQEWLNYSATSISGAEIKKDAKFDCEFPVQIGGKCDKKDGLIATPKLYCNGHRNVTLRGEAGGTKSIDNTGVLSGYIAIGGVMNAGAIKQSGDTLEIHDQLISASLNPYGNSDTSGIYYLAAGNQKVSIQNSRIEATLVIIDAKEINVEGGIIWRYPADPDAILITDSKVTVKNVDEHIDERRSSRNFNPPSFPYRGTSSDSDQSDRFPSEITGLIHTTDDLELESENDRRMVITGAVYCDKLKVDHFVSLRHLHEVISNPPVLLSSSDSMIFVHGSWKRIINP